MRRPTATDNEEGPGQDSFLDIVTNIVGILIILVMVVGVQAKDAWIEAADKEVEEVAEEEIDVETPREAAVAVEADIHALTQKMQQLQTELAVKFQRRDQMQLLLTAAQRELDRRRDELDESARHQFEQDRQLADARRELEELKRQQFAVEQARGHVEVIEHLPTPLAKTVFGKEQHFQLLHGRLAYVPLNELVDQLRREWQEKVWRLENSPQTTETIGPLDGFRMKYTLERKRIEVPTSQGTVVQEVAGLARFVLVPVSGELGEPVADALAANSEFRRRLQSYDPQSTTVTVWCYPDTFDSFREIKRELYRLGFRTAGRPLPEGHPIGGAPDGSRSVAE